MRQPLLVAYLWGALSGACSPQIMPSTPKPATPTPKPAAPTPRESSSLPAGRLSKVAPSKLPARMPLGEGDLVPMVGWVRHDGARELADQVASKALLMDFFPLPLPTAAQALGNLQQHGPALAQAGVEVRAFALLSPPELRQWVKTSSLGFPLAAPSPELLRSFAIVTSDGRTTRQAFLIRNGRIQRVWQVDVGTYIDEVLELMQP